MTSHFRDPVASWLCLFADESHQGYTTHQNTNYNDAAQNGGNQCVNGEGGASCKLRCDADSTCIMFALYQSGSSAGRCCTKSYGPEVGGATWAEGSHFVKGLLHAGEQCWHGYTQGQGCTDGGPCAFCGSGRCCRQGVVDRRCNGTMGGTSRRECIAVDPGTVRLRSLHAPTQLPFPPHPLVPRCSAQGNSQDAWL